MVFTDGSCTETGVDTAICATKDNIVTHEQACRLDDKNSVYKVKFFAIHEALSSGFLIFPLPYLYLCAVPVYPVYKLLTPWNLPIHKYLRIQSQLLALIHKISSAPFLGTGLLVSPNRPLCVKDFPGNTFFGRSQSPSGSQSKRYTLKESQT